MTRVKMPKNVAQEIVRLRNDGRSNADVYAQITEVPISPAERTVSRSSLMEALVNGYEVERTPHEELREYYESLNTTGWPSDAYVDSGRRNGIKETLRILGIKVEGVNVSCDE